MANTTKTELQLVTRFADNTAGLISAQDGRDFVTSTFPYQASADPTAECDLANSAGVPDATGFDTGNTWLNVVTGSWWFCQTGVLHSAVWVVVFPQAQVFLARLTNVAQACTALQVIAPLQWGSDSNSVECTDHSIYPDLGVPMSIDFLGFRADGDVLRLNPSFFSLLLNTHEALPGMCLNAVCTPECSEWVECYRSPVSGVIVDKPGGKSGTKTTGPAFSMANPPYFPAQNDYVWMSYRSDASGIPVFDYVPIDVPDPLNIAIGSPTQTSPTVVNYYGNGTYNTTINFDVYSIIVVNSFIQFNYTPGIVYPPCSLSVGPDCTPQWTGPTGNVLPIGTGTSWKKLVVKWSDFPGPSTTITILTLVARQGIGRVLFAITTVWHNLSGGTTNIAIGYSGGSGGTSNPTAYGSRNVVAGGSPQPLTDPATMNGTGPGDFPNFLSSYQLTARCINPGDATSGECTVWIELLDLR